MKTAHSILGACAALTFSLAIAAEASAQTGFVSAGSGKSVRVDAYLGWKDDCSHLPINIDIINPPKHGKLTPRFENEKIRKASIGGVKNCFGRTVRALALYYRSAKGYRGADSFSVRIAVGNQPAVYNYSVNVR